MEKNDIDDVYDVDNMMEKRNVATERRTHGVYDDEELRREADLFGAPEKRASAKNESVRKADEDADEDTLHGHG